MSCSFDDVTSRINICIGIAVADSIKYHVPTWYRSNPKAVVPCQNKIILKNFSVLFSHGNTSK